MTRTTEQERATLLKIERSLMGRSLDEWVMETGAVALNSSWHGELAAIVRMAFDKGVEVEQAARRAPAVPVPKSIEQMAVDRYKVVPSHESMFHRWAVVADDGQQQLYIGRAVECQNMARKFTGAFLDGAFVALAAPRPAAAALAPSIAVTPEMVEAANEAYCPFGDMELALCAALQVAPIPPGAAPVKEE